jgi:hypothetical protein
MQIVFFSRTGSSMTLREAGSRARPRAGTGAAARVGVAAVLTAAALAGCSSSGHPAAGGSSGPGTSAPAGGSSAPGTGAGTGPASGTPADAATTTAITKAYRDFFDSTSTTPQSEAALQHGAAFHETLVEQGKTSYSQHSGVQVGAISVRGPVADVTFTITGNGAPLLSDVRGFAVQEGGRWKVAAKTFCTLLKLEGTPPPACSDPSITALPGA